MYPESAAFVCQGNNHPSFHPQGQGNGSGRNCRCPPSIWRLSVRTGLVQVKLRTCAAKARHLSASSSRTSQSNASPLPLLYTNKTIHDFSSRNKPLQSSADVIHDPSAAMAAPPVINLSSSPAGTQSRIPPSSRM